MALRLLVNVRFQVLFHSPHRGAFHLSLTVLVHYRSLEVFSLGRWTPLLPTGLACPVVLRTSGGRVLVFAYGALTLFGLPSQCSSANNHLAHSLVPGPTTPIPARAGPVWASPLSLATTQGILSFPAGT